MFFERRHERSTRIAREGSVVSRAHMSWKDDKPLGGRPSSIGETACGIAISPADAVPTQLQVGLENMCSAL